MPASLRRVLLPTDFSKGSEIALEYAVDLARRDGAELIVLHVVEDFADYSLLYSDFFPFQKPVNELYERAEERTRQKIEELVASCGEPVPRHRAIVTTGSPHREIVRAVAQERIDLVVIATHGRSGFAHALLGSTAERVVRHAPCPVLVVRRPAEKVEDGDDAEEGAEE